MSVELPYAPVDGIIRRNADGLRVSAAATEELTHRIETHGANLAVSAAARADEEDRKTLMAADFPGTAVPRDDDLTLPIAPVDRIARLKIDDSYRVSSDARVALATLLETFADDVARGATTLARHADRRTVTENDIMTYFELLPRE